MLRLGDAADIKKMFDRMVNERRLIIEGLIQLVYFMRGAIQYRDMIDMTYVERQAINDFIEKRLEDESKKMYPVY